MPKTKISEYSVTNSSNTDIEGINIDEGCAPSGINNAIRELMVHLKEFQTGASGDAFTFAGGVLISGTANTITGNVLMSGTNTITGSTTATFAAGAVGTPSIAAHGDTNTGIFFPAADTIAFAEGGAEAMRIDSSGNVGIGVTPSASWGTSNFKALQIKNGSVAAQSTADLWLFSNAVYDGSNFKYVSSNPAANYRSDSGTHTWSAAASGTAGNNITFTQVLAVERTKSLALEGATSQSGTGITFPATQSASSDANTLDDYEEGTFTPTLASGFSTAPTSYTNQLGRYTKIGRVVYFEVDIDPNGAISNATAVQFGGLPFTSALSPYGSVTVGFQGSFNTNTGDTLLVNDGTTVVQIYVNSGLGRLGNNANVSINARIVFSGWYTVA